MEKLALKIFGLVLTVLVSDPATFIRFLWLKKKLKKGRLRTLDAGCGSGAFTMYAAKIGNDAVGVSFNPRNNAVARERARTLGLQNVSFIDGNLRDLSGLVGNAEKFDQIICFETIEHIMDHEKLLRDFHGLLKSDGRVLITTPYKHYRRFPGDYVSPVEDGSHVRWGYELSEMRNLLEAAGFKIESEEYIVGVVPQILWRIMTPLNAALPRLGWLVTFPLRLFTVIDRPLTALLRYPCWMIAVVAKKV